MKSLKLNRTTLGVVSLLSVALMPSLLWPTTAPGAARTAIAWGSNSNGQTNVPLDLTNAIAVGAGAVQSLAIRQDGTVSVWGGDSTWLTNINT